MKLSLCITCYDKDYHLLYDLINDITNQSVAPDEIIIYCSGLSRLEHINKFISINGNVTPVSTICSQKRTNQAIGRNICSKIASSDYIMFFDVDDRPHPDKISITKYVILKYQCDFFLHNYNTINNYHNIIHNTIMYPIPLYPLDKIDNNSTNIICHNFPIHHAHITVNIQVFKNIAFNEDKKYYRKEDGKFCQDLIKSNYIGLYCPIKLVHYLI